MRGFETFNLALCMHSASTPSLPHACMALQEPGLYWDAHTTGAAGLDCWSGDTQRQRPGHIFPVHADCICFHEPLDSGCHSMTPDACMGHVRLVNHANWGERFRMSFLANEGSMVKNGQFFWKRNFLVANVARRIPETLPRFACFEKHAPQHSRHPPPPCNPPPNPLCSLHSLAQTQAPPTFPPDPPCTHCQP